MLTLRLQRIGRRNHAEFRVVVTEHARAASSSSYVELLGSYSPHTNKVQVNKDRVTYWLGVGAQPSGTVHNLLVNEGIIKGKKRNVLPKKQVPVAVTEEAAPTAEATPASTESASEAAAA